MENKPTYRAAVLADKLNWFSTSFGIKAPSPDARKAGPASAKVNDMKVPFWHTFRTSCRKSDTLAFPLLPEMFSRSST